jgi:hypothetical protein
MRDDQIGNNSETCVVLYCLCFSATNNLLLFSALLQLSIGSPCSVNHNKQHLDAKEEIVRTLFKMIKRITQGKITLSAQEEMGIPSAANIVKNKKGKDKDL